MGQILVRNLDEDTIRRLKALATRHGRSLQRQVKVLLEEGAQLSATEVRSVVEKWSQRFAGKRFSDSAKLIREDRRG